MKDILKGVVHIGIFAMPFIVLIVANSLFFPFITGKNFAFRIIVEIIFASWVLLAMYDPQYRPKFSWILGTLGVFLGVMFFANLFGVHPEKSFWSNFERMAGYVTLIHFFAYFLVVGSVLKTEKMWNRFFNTTLIAAVILSFYAFAQLSGNITINQGGWRVDGTLGNSAYMAVYMLFHIFIAALMLVRTENKGLRYVYGALVLLFIYLLVQTATRGAILGLVGGGFLTMLYIVFFAKGYPKIRTYGIYGVSALVILAALFFVARDSAFIQENPYLSRVANISLEDGAVRFAVWGMALEGVKERPILGWGQGNFNYVFNEHYNAEVMHSAEPWYDRVHNIVLDWAISGGILGALAYFSIIFATVYYLLIRPMLRPHDESMSVAERGLLFGLLAAYVFHNLFVFDNVVSYIFFAVILAFIHVRVATEIPSVEAKRFDERSVEQIAAPIVAVALAGVFYFVNVPGMLAAGDIIDAFRTQNVEERIAAFERALSRNSFADQEIREQLTQQVQGILRSSNVSEAKKQEYFRFAESELQKQIEEKPGDARVHVFLASFYRGTGNLEAATEQLKVARSLSPDKQAIIFEQGLNELQKNNPEKALEYFTEAYELDTEFPEARVFYAIGALYNDQPELANELIDSDRVMQNFSNNDIAVQAAYSAKEYDLLTRMFTDRIERKPNAQENWVSLAVVQHESGDTEAAIETLTEASEQIPNFSEQAEQFIADLRAGRMPGQPAEEPTVEVGSESVEVETSPAP